MIHDTNMGISFKFMGHPIFFLIFSLLLIPTTSTHLQSSSEREEQGYISVLVSNKGLDFVKDVLIYKAVSSMVPLQLSNIEKSVKIAVIGKVGMVLSDIIIDSLSVGSSYVETREEGLFLVVSGATANLSMKWKYSYSTWVVVISDSGDASVQVKGMEVSLTLVFDEEEGTLKLTPLDCGCYVKDISIKLDGGASWLYQVLVDAFLGPIGSAVEDAISKKIKDGIAKLDSRLESLPKQIPIDNVAALNVTFVDNLVLTNSSIEVNINGLFTAINDILPPTYYSKGMQASFSCKNPAKMIAISFNENVFNSAALLYFKAGYMHWTVDKFLNQSLFNTAAWRYVYPQLYTQYPNDDMNLNVSVTSPPVIRILERGIYTTLYLNVTVNVLDAGNVVPVACVSLVINASCSPKILRNRLAGMLKLKNFTASLEWSKIGNLHMRLLKSLMYAVIETVFIPYLNLHLMRGFPLPLPQGLSLRNVDIDYTYSKIILCSNLAVQLQAL